MFNKPLMIGGMGNSCHFGNTPVGGGGGGLERLLFWNPVACLPQSLAVYISVLDGASKLY